MTGSIDRPIFIVGHARGGTTLLSAVINWHPDVGPKPFPRHFDEISEFVNNILSHDIHLQYSERIEQKEIWFKYFPGLDVFTHMGKEIIVEELRLPGNEKEELARRLTKDCQEKRYLSKAPTNSFRVKAIKQLFPDAKIVAIYRAGPEVVNSWGKRAYGFGKSVSWGEVECRRLSYRKGITIFARKWFETIEYLESIRDELDFVAITYDDLIENPHDTLTKVFSYLELPMKDYVNYVPFADQRAEWKKELPWYYHKYLITKTKKGMKLYNQVRSNKG